MGFHAGGWLLAIMTAILGAAALGNLALIVLDITWDRTDRIRFHEGMEGVSQPAERRTRVGVR